MTQDLADRLMSETNVPQLRDLCSEAGVSRERGASKRETVEALAAASPDAVYEFLGEEPPTPGYEVTCPCGLWEKLDDEGEAVDLAESHADGCSSGLGVDGLGGLAVWSEEYGNRVWIADEN